MAVQVWFVNGQKVELDIDMEEAWHAVTEREVRRYDDRDVVVAWAHVTHVTTSSDRRRDRGIPSR